uniref:CSON002228 protein n=1 Tax=Culicoides sonorensis TaxID=179676 RepID=A0A336L0U6_CULSO
MKHSNLGFLFILLAIPHIHCEIEDKLYFASVRNRFNEFVGCASIISPNYALTAANVVQGKQPHEIFITLGNHNESNFGYQHLPEVYFERVMDSYLRDIKNKTNCGSENNLMNHTSSNTIEIAEADFKVISMRKILRFSSVSKIPTSHIRAIEKIIIHPIFNSTGKFNSNIAILRLEHSIKIQNLVPLRMDLSPEQNITNSLLLGWTKYHAYEKGIVITENVTECAETARKNYSNTDYLCIKNAGQPLAGVMGNPCLAGCPIVQNDTLVGLVTVSHKRLTKNGLLLAISKGKLLAFIQAAMNGIDFNDWQKDIEGLVEQFVKNVVDKAFF